ncbi:MAG: hypothetical protein E6H62_00640, partial [Betaproteobacteria bacterium]
MVKPGQQGQHRCARTAARPTAVRPPSKSDVTTRSTSTSITLEATSEPRPAELSFSQRRLWFLDQIDPGGAAYVMAKALEMRGVIDVPMLERALGGLFSRHESLRTVFVNLNGHPMQVVSEPGALT